MDFTRQTMTPAPMLRGVVGDFWVIERRDAPRPEGRQVHLAPDGAVHLVFRVERFRAGSSGQSESSQLYVRGPATCAKRWRAHAAPEILGVQLRPGAARAILGVSPEEIVDGTVTLSDLGLDRRGDLQGRLSEAPDPAARVSVLQAFLLDRLASSRTAPDPRILDAVGRLARTEDGAITGLAASLGVGDRQLRRLLRVETGLSPKRLARIARFQRLFRALRERTPRSLADLAHATGYADQAHMVREFKEMTTLTPAAWVGRGATACPFSSRPGEL
jgi:AraC-like DNA-binding protein